ncbi:MAG: hypothetical protein HZB53_16760 [Chloroflexi bacterium]|nr:hypothetical protein [Chloroflexota bacterium]
MQSQESTKPNRLALFRSRLSKPQAQPAFGLVLLLLAAAAGYQFRFLFTFVDEGDNIMAGWLATRSLRLYADVATYHFPFEYGLIWSTIVLFGKSIGAIRMAALGFNLVVFAATMWATRQYVAVGFVALAWCLSGPFYFGHMATYHALTGPLIASVFLITLMALHTDAALRRGAGIVLGLCAGIALIANPLMAAPLAVAGAALALRRTWGRQLALAAGVAGVIVIAGALALVLAGTLAAFYELAIRFTLDVYSQYPLGPPLPPDALARGMLAGLYMQGIGWMNNVPPTFAWSEITPNFVDQIAFTGLSLRWVAVLGTAALAFRKQWVAACFTYIFLLATLLRARDFFQVAPYIVPSLMFGVWLIVTRSSARGISRWLSRLAGIAAALTMAWMISRDALYATTQSERLSFEASWGGYVARAGELRRLTCERDDVSMLYYPLDSIFYFLADIPPASRYQVVYQWTADTLPVTIARLSRGKHLVYVDWSKSIWGYKVSDYAKPLAEFLNANYVAKPGNIYLSPELAKLCP